MNIIRSALFFLSRSGENRIRIVEAGAVEVLMALMNPGSGMEDKATVAIALLARLATFADGWAAIAEAEGIAALAEVVELGSAKL